MNQENIDMPSVITEQRGSLGVITLNRPKALNALSLEMIREIAATLKDWEDDASIAAVVFLGSGDRAFCSGGDIKSFHSAGMDFRRGRVGISVPALFFAEEYSLNKQIFEYRKPTIAIMDGIVMGGGYGIAGNCRHRLATKNTIFAMPEVSIGFFPDVGSVYHLIRTPHHFGRYLALTGAHIKAGDMLAANLADGYINFEDQNALIDLLAEGDVEKALDAHLCEAPQAQVFDDYASHIEKSFESLNVFNICSSLREIGSVWATDALDHLMSRSPLSVMVTARYLNEMVDKEFDDVIAMDYQLAQHFISYPDMYEGIRAALIDKDKKPEWQPSKFDDVKQSEIDRYFSPATQSFGDVRIFA